MASRMGRRYFVDIVESFPDECRKVLDALGVVYKNDAETREQKMTAQDRLLFHQEHSRPPMKELKDWMQAQLDDKRVEPNSHSARSCATRSSTGPRSRCFSASPALRSTTT